MSTCCKHQRTWWMMMKLSIFTFNSPFSSDVFKTPSKKRVYKCIHMHVYYHKILYFMAFNVLEGRFLSIICLGWIYDHLHAGNPARKPPIPTWKVWLQTESKTLRDPLTDLGAMGEVDQMHPTNVGENFRKFPLFPLLNLDFFKLKPPWN